MKNQLRFRIILASESEAFAKEREELKAFVESLNDEKSNVCYELVTEEVLQKEGDAGQSFYLLVGEEFPEEESVIFHKVYDRFRETGAPVMYTYFRKKNDELPTQSVKAFMTELDEEIGHFFSTYEELDSVKLGILLELARGTGMEDAFTVRDGAAFFRGREALSLENLPLYKENESLKQLLAQQKELAAQFAAAAAACAYDPENPTLKMEKEEISGKQIVVFDAIHKQEEELCALLLEVAGLTGGEGMPTSAQKLAIRELENGNYENAEQILRKADRSLAFETEGAILQANKNVLAGYVSENRLLIKTLMASGLTRERADEIGKCWEENLRLTKEYRLDPCVLDDYIGFLLDCREEKKALEVLDLLEKLYQLADVPETEQAELLQKRAIAKEGLKDYKEAERLYLQAIRHLRLQADKGQQEKLFSIITNNCYRLGEFESYRFRKFEQAKRYLDEAEKGYLKLYEEDPAYWETKLSMVYRAQGEMYQNWIKKGSKNIKKAEEKYQKALEICERRADEDLMGMGSQLADVLLSYAELKERQGKKTESYDMRKRAFDIYEQMTKKSPVLYQLDWGRAASEAFRMELADQREKDNRIQKDFLEILRLGSKARELANDNPQKKKYLEKAISLCADVEKLGALRSEMGDTYGNYVLLCSGEERAASFEKAWDIYNKCFPKAKTECLQGLDTLLEFFWEQDGGSEANLHKAEELLKLAAVMDTDEEKTAKELVSLHGICGNIYQDCGKIREAEKQYLLAKDFLLWQLEKNPGNLANRTRLQRIEMLSRYLYLKDYPYSIKDTYREEELGALLKCGAAGNPAVKIQGHQYSGEEKFKFYADCLMKAGDKYRKKAADRKKAEFDYQAAKILYRQLANDFPGRYQDELRVIEARIEDLHSQWKDD